MGRRPSVAVVGAGVVGLTVALELLRNVDVDVTVISEDPIGSPNTPSAVATAIWHVYLVDPNDSRVLAWAANTLRALLELAETEPAAAVYTVRGRELYRTSPQRVPRWASIPSHFRLLDADEVAAYKDISWGYVIDAPLAEMKYYLPWLAKCVTSAKGELRQVNHLTRLEDVPREFPIVINCTGLRARELTGDTNLYAVRGQYLVLKRPVADPGDYIGDDEHPEGMAYMIPRRDDVCIGGTEEHGEESLSFEADVSRMIARVGATSPWLRDCSPNDVLQRVVGLRPARRGGVRLELETLGDGRPVIHNYGHGGSGFSLSWGCASEVSAIVRDLA